MNQPTQEQLINDAGLNIDDLRYHTEVGTGLTKDAMLNRAADEIEMLRAELLGKSNAEPVAYTSTYQLQHMEERDGGSMWFPFDKEFESDAKEAGFDTKQVALYLEPPRASLPAEQDAEPFAWYREGNAINPNHIQHINEKGETVYIEFRMSTPPENRGWMPLAIANRKDGV